ncbi:nucleoside hydrolase [Gluconobacter sphaericus]|uniref:nucleoside hydrolase n=1 Tax=Gluconobacter sphaericus TaxID=574987 RepID=UPI0019246A79|nr:nucleoside hydrolase [Gluconobacter sphaericus]QQX91993.1 nucleoside hydrolase [Gluconobacter sphaericus]
MMTQAGSASIIPRRIVIDTDPGQDDAVAILLALASPELTVEAITTVAGNVPVALTTKNACALLELAGRTDIPVFGGAARPLHRAPISAEHVHGETGMAGADLPEPTLRSQAIDAATWLVDLLRREPEGAITLVCLGPMTNLALALSHAPDIAARIAGVVAMGGAQREGGNITPTAEFNFFVDPHAARIVMHSGIPITLLPLDVTHRAIATPARLAPIAAIGSPVTDMVVRMLGAEDRFEKQKYGWEGGALHDPLTIGFLLWPELFSGRDCNVEIEVDASLCVGQSVVDLWNVTNRVPNALWINDVDSDAFYSLLTERLALLD